MNHADFSPDRGVFRQLFESSPDPAWIIDDSRFVECNEIALRILGYASREEFLNVHPSKLSPPRQADGEDSYAKAERMMAIARENGVHRFEWIHTKVDGTNFDAEVTLAAVEIENRQVIYCVWRDITERKKAEVALQESKKQFLALSTMSSDWFWQQDDQFRFTEFSGAFASDFTPPADSLGKTRWELNVSLTPEQWAAHRALLDAHLPFRNLEYPISDDNGEVRWYSINGEPLFDESGRFTGYHGTGRNITASKQAEARLQLAASVFTHAREGIVITDAHGAILEVNDTFSLITGYGREEVLGKNMRLLQSGRQTPEFYAAMWQELATQDHWSGELWNRRKRGELYAQMLTISAVRDGEGKAQNYVALLSDITAIKDYQRQLELLAHFDPLTRLPNRLLLADRLHQAMTQCPRHGRSLAVVYLDLDNIKAVNDQYGHGVGDTLLIEVSKRMKEALREGDTLARIGGDEFVAVIVDLQHPHDGHPVFERLLQAAALPVRVRAGTQEDGEADELMLRVSASIGVTFYPQDRVDADQLMRHADQAMYVAKQTGKNRYHLFDIDQEAAIQTRHESLGRIRKALDQEEFVLYYQPEVNIRTGRVTGAEALIRWRHPQQGLLQPVAFLPTIENHPVSVEVGEWVINTALAQMSAWHAQGLDLQVSVNIDAGQLQQENFAARLSECLAAYPDVKPQSLRFEVLETSALEDIVKVSAAMNACHCLGVSFSLDDFGTGYSSLTYLKRLPAETLKIDQSFVRDMLDDPSDLAIVKGVIGLAQAFGRRVIAEGVETRAHGDMLLSLGCELAQGYGIAQPMHAKDVPGWVARWHTSAVWAA